MKQLRQKPPKIRISLRLTWLSLVLLCALIIPVGAQAIGIADGLPSAPLAKASRTPTRTASPTKKLPPTVVAPSQEVSWLANPQTYEELASSQSYAILAGHFIHYGLVNASAACNGNFGLLANGYASTCGERAARKAVIVWQNQYDKSIFNAAGQYDVPAYMLKNVIVQESQFWPAKHLTIYGYYEYGLGHITQMGADTLLRWNDDFAKSQCLDTFSSKTCKTTYAWLAPNEQAMLRGSVMKSLDAECDNCPGGVNLQRANESIETVAATLNANYNHMVWLLSGMTAGAPYRIYGSSLLWRLALSSYNAGPGCVTTAIQRTSYQRLSLNWKNISQQFDEGCAGAVAYVDQVTSDPQLADPAVLLDAMMDKSPATRMVLEYLGIDAPEPTPLPVTATAKPGKTVTPTEGTPTGDVPTETPTSQTPVATVEFTPTDGSPTATEMLGATASPTLPATEGTPEATATPTMTAENPEATPTGLDASDATPSPTVLAGTPEATATSMDPTDATPSATPTATSGTLEATATNDGTPSVTPTAGSPEATATNDGTPSATPTAGTPEATMTSTLPVETGTPTVTLTPEFTPTAMGGEPDLKSPHVKNELLIKIDPASLDSVLLSLVDLGIVAPRPNDNVELLDTYVIDVAPEKLEETLAALRNIRGIEFVEPNYLAQLASLPNDPYFPLQTGLAEMQIPETWDALPNKQQVVVAVLDTGVDAVHPDLADRMWVNAGETGVDASGNDKNKNGIDDDNNGYVDDWRGWNMVKNSNDIIDTQGHGTHLAGIIGASINNSTGISGIAPNARIMAVKVLDSTGYGSYAQVSEGIVYATDMGAKIINLGFGGIGSSEYLQNAVNYAVNHGVLVVAASGNGGTDVPYYPAAYPGVIAVSALGEKLTWAPFSSIGAHISLSAPGTGIYSTMRGGGYAQLSGSSQSSANVSGVAALLASQPQFANVDNLRSALLGSALDLGAPGQDPYFGYGSVRAFDALGYYGPVLPTPTPWPAPTTDPNGYVSPQAITYLWATGSSPSFDATTNNLVNSTDRAFNDLLADSTAFYGANGRNWVFDAFLPSTGSTYSFGPVTTAQLDFRYYIPAYDAVSDSGWVDDIYYIQVQSPLCGGGTLWCTVKILDAPSATLTTLSLDVTSLFSGATVTQASTIKVQIVGTGVNAPSDYVTIYMDEVGLRVTTDIPTATPAPSATPLFEPTATLPASRAPTATPLANEPHSHFALGSFQFCAACHRGHSALSANGMLFSKATEKVLCLNCHGTGGVATDIQTSLDTTPNTATRYYSHPVSSAPNIHTSSESTGSSFGGASRHVECSDCHVAHNSAYAQANKRNDAPAVQQEMYGSGGVEPAYSATGAPGSFTWLPTAEREYQVCFKCHSSFTTLPTYSPFGLFKIYSATASQVRDSRDLAQEFNPYQASFHPVLALGRNREISPDSFVAGWSIDTMVTCTDCHTNGSGPHGSANLHILDTTTGGLVCYKCHQEGTYRTGTNPRTTTHFVKGTRNLHSYHVTTRGVTCYTCHDTHGSENARLINFDTAQVSMLTGYDSQTAWKLNVNGTRTCYISCHDPADPNFTYTP